MNIKIFRFSFLMIGFLVVIAINLFEGGKTDNQRDNPIKKNDSSFDFSESHQAKMRVDREDGTSFEEKVAKEIYLNKKHVDDLDLITSQKIYQKLISRGAIIDKDLAKKMMSEEAAPDDWREISMLISSVLEEEEHFKIELSKYSSFKDLKAACDSRAKKTGYFYGNDLLEQENAYKDATVDDIVSLLNEGAILPEDAIFLMVKAGNVSLAADLYRAGRSIDINYVDKYKTQNILESYIFNYTLFDDGKTLKTIDTLLEMGVVPNMNDGTRNSLDYVLANINSQNFSSRVDVAQKLINAGISIEKSHYEILETLKSKNPELYMEFINKTKIQ